MKTYAYSISRWIKCNLVMHNQLNRVPPFNFSSCLYLQEAILFKDKFNKGSLGGWRKVVCKMENVRRFQFRYIPSWVCGERYLKATTFMKQTQTWFFCPLGLAFYWEECILLSSYLLLHQHKFTAIGKKYIYRLKEWIPVDQLPAVAWRMTCIQIVQM